ncbi:MAG: hypothetical protein WC613_00250 [Candidatus Aenigmatarchaeota archaeon]
MIRIKAVILTAAAYVSTIGILSYNTMSKPSYPVASVSQSDSRKPPSFLIYSRACDGKYDGVRQLDAGTLMDHPFFEPLAVKDAAAEAIGAIDQLNLGVKYDVFFQRCRAQPNTKLREI